MAHGRRTRILIVDDSAVIRNLLRSVISSDPSSRSPGPRSTAPPRFRQSNLCVPTWFCLT